VVVRREFACNRRTSCAISQDEARVARLIWSVTVTNDIKSDATASGHAKAVGEGAGEEDESAELVPTKSKLSEEIDRLKRASIDALSSRERIPQPLFWSLFHSELAGLKKRKHLERFIEQVFEESAAQSEPSSAVKK
jgi:hypothetical protein